LTVSNGTTIGGVFDVESKNIGRSIAKKRGFLIKKFLL
jgi:hypothetical protein